MSAGSTSKSPAKSSSHSPSHSSSLVAIDFEVFGKVQGVFFRKYTQQECQKLGLKGWVMNTDRQTVVGRAEGPKNKVADLKRWLRTTGSPKSRIEKAQFSEEAPLAQVSSKEFIIKR